MYINSDPVGANPPLQQDRIPIWKVTNGDSLILDTQALLPHSTVPATPENSELKFVLAQSQFDRENFWTGLWRDGIEPIEDVRPGYVRIHIPDKVASTLRRGSYQFSLTVTNLATRQTQTLINAYMLMEYVPGSPNHAIPYVWESEFQTWDKTLQDSDIV